MAILTLLPTLKVARGQIFVLEIENTVVLSNMNNELLNLTFL